MMDESDEDFKELCASFFQRVKKNVPKETSGERKPRRASEGTRVQSKPRRTKQTKSRALPGPTGRKTRSGSQAPRTKNQGATQWQETEPAAPEDREEGPPESTQSTQTGAPSHESQCTPSHLTVTMSVPSPSKPRATELVLQRMQQFKRACPERLRHACDGSSPETTPEGNTPEEPEDKALKGAGTESDTTVAWALQQELGQLPAPVPQGGLEEAGLFFCQICQKDLSAMNPTRREQHVNRCLDEAEKVLAPVAPEIPECPICGRPFLTPKSRLSHLKQCATRMEVAPRLLLQAVRMQTAQPRGPQGESPASVTGHVGALKRKAATGKKESQKRRKLAGLGAPCEDLLVAMALSRSEMEQEALPLGLRAGTAVERTQPRAEKKGRRKKGPTPTPQLLLQDAETTGRQIEDRVAQLFAEEPESDPPSTPPLPASRILRNQRGKPNLLWTGSALTSACTAPSFYTAGLVPPLVPQRSRKVLTQEPVPALEPDQGTRTARPVGHDPWTELPSTSQRERQALQDLVELAGEGLGACQWPSSGSSTSTGGDTGVDAVPGDLPLTGFVLPAEEKTSEGPSQAALALGLLLADFGAMVNNPHLSDVQLQTDSGEVLYAHKFVLYARCPLLMQHVNSDGFLASEDGDLRSLRVLLRDVSAEAARAFLLYLYAADTSPPAQLAPDLSSLARRFGVSELAHLCEQAATKADPEGARWEEDAACQDRAENFQELLRAVWDGEDRDPEAELRSKAQEEDREKVNDAEMDEIYEFAATQRKLLKEDRTPEAEEGAQLEEEGPDFRHLPAPDAEQGHLSQTDRVEALARRSGTSQAVLLPEGPRAEAPGKAPGPASPWHPSQGCWASREEDTLVHPVDLEEDDQPFPSAQGGQLTPSQTSSDGEEGGCSVPERLDGSPQPQPRPFFSLSQPPPQSGSPQQPQLPSEFSQPSPPAQGGTPKTPSQDSPSQQRRGRSVLTARKDLGFQKGLQCSTTSEGRRGVLVSPEKSPSIDLTQARSNPSSYRPPPASTSRDDEVILLLDSDEELELEQSRAQSTPSQVSEGQKAPETTSCELFPVINVDEDQDGPQSPQWGLPPSQRDSVGPGDLSSLGGMGTPRLFRDPGSSPEDGTTDSSWLVPATPLTRSRDCSAQTKISGLRLGEAMDQQPQLRSRAMREERALPKAATFSVIVPHTPPPGPISGALGGPGRGRQAPRSPHGPQPRRHSLSLPASHPAPGNLPVIPQKRLGPAATSHASEVVEVEDSEDEQEATTCPANSSPQPDSDPPIPVDDCCWHVEPLSPIPIDHLNLERTGPLSTSSPCRGAAEGGDRGSPVLSTTPVRGSRASRRRSECAGSPGSSRLSFLNSMLWDDWDAEEPKSPELPTLAHTPSKPVAPVAAGLETPKAAGRKKNLPPKMPITPMPQYSILETPELKRQLDRFGVRPLPKRQMVLKLKEIFQYTHQTLDSDSGDEGQSPKGPLEAARAADCTQPSATTGSGPQRPKGPRSRKRQPSRRAPPPHTSPAKEVPPGPDGDQLPASQDSVATAMDTSDRSFSSQSSSSCELGAALESAGDDEEGEEVVGATQTGATAEMLYHYIRSQPALYRRVLQYQPLELAELRAELRQQGLRVAAGTLLDFLDAQGITFTTAAARREKGQRARRRPAGKRKAGRSGRPAAPSPPPASSP